MAEKTDTKKIEASKESYKAPVAKAAEEVRKESEEKADKEKIKEKINEELEKTGESKSSEKTDFEATKKTVDAHGTLSEKEAEEKAKKSEEVTEKMIEKEEGKEEIEKEREDAKKTEEFEKEEAEEKEKKEDEKKSGRSDKGRGRRRGRRDDKEDLSQWVPKTKLGRQVKKEEIKNIDEILDSGRVILEEQIVDSLLDIKSDLISIGQAKGKFGGGKRRAWRQTQRKTKEGNVPTFSTMAVVGDGNGHIGIGEGRSSETLPARDKAIRQAKLSLIRIQRGCSAFDCACDELHTIPFEVNGKSGSVKVTLIPAPQGTGLVVGKELKKVLSLAGIEDVYSRTEGRKRTTFNLVKACFEALNKTNMRNK